MSSLKSVLVRAVVRRDGRAAEGHQRACREPAPTFSPAATRARLSCARFAYRKGAARKRTKEGPRGRRPRLAAGGRYVLVFGSCLIGDFDLRDEAREYRIKTVRRDFRLRQYELQAFELAQRATDGASQGLAA